MRTGPRHAGPRPSRSWWRGPWPPSMLLAVLAAALVWAQSWAAPLLWGDA